MHVKSNSGLHLFNSIAMNCLCAHFPLLLSFSFCQSSHLFLTLFLYFAQIVAKSSKMKINQIKENKNLILCSSNSFSLGGFFLPVFIHWIVDFAKKETVAGFFLSIFLLSSFHTRACERKKSTYLFVKIYFLCTMAIYF